MNFDKYLDRVYNSSKYNCTHFVCEIWNDLFKQDISKALGGALRAQRERRINAHDLASFKRLALPVAPCIALFQISAKAPHVGIFLNGRILHITESGVEWNCLEIIMLNFNKVRFYSVKANCNS